MFLRKIENIYIIFHMMGVIYIFNVSPDRFVSLPQWFFWPFTSFIITMYILCTVKKFTWGNNWLQYFIINQICVKLIIFSCILICLGGYWLLIWFLDLSLHISWKLGVVEVVFKGPLVNTGRCQFFYQVCVNYRYLWMWFMSNDIVLQFLNMMF